MNLRSIVVFVLVSFWLLSFSANAQPRPDLQPGLDLFNGEKYSEAQAFFQSLADEFPQDAPVAYYCGRSYFVSRDNKKAIASLKRAVKLDGENADYPYLLGMAYLVAINDVGMLKKIRYAKKMKKAWFAAIELDAAHKEAHVAIIGFYLNAPALAGGSLKKGAKHLSILKQRFPGEIFPMEASLAEKREAYPEAEKIYRQAFEKNPLPRYLFGLAGYLIRREQLDEAADHLRTYLTLDLAWNDPSKATAQYMLASILADKKMKKEAIETLQLAKADNTDKFLGGLIDKKLEELN